MKEKNTPQGASAQSSSPCPFPYCTRETLEHMVFIMDHLPVCIAYVDKDQRYQYNNPYYKQWFNISAEECRGKYIHDVIGVDAYNNIKSYIEKVLQGKTVCFSTSYTTQVGQFRYARVTLQPDIDQQGTCRGFAILAMNISEEQKAIRALKTSQQQYLQLFDEMVAGLILFEVIPPEGGARQDYRFIKVNKAWQAQTGTPADRVLGKTVSETFPRIDDLRLDAMDRVHRTGQPESMEDYFIELTRFYDVSYFKPQQGLIACSLTDITERKLAEQRLVKSKKQMGVQLNRSRKSQENTLKRLERETNKRSSLNKQLFLSDSVFLHTSEGICITDAEGTIEQINLAFTAITGYISREVVGSNLRILKSDHHDQAFYQDMWHRLLTKGSWCGEIWNRRKNGETYPVYLTITAVADDQGKVTHYVALFHDISELKAGKDKLVHQSLHDALTGMPNRTLLADHCETLINQADCHNEQLVVALVDIDDFKDINESLGYETGDIVLQHVAERISECCRTQDVVAHMGGDKFALLLTNITSSIDEALIVLTRIMKQLSSSFSVHEHTIFIKSSIGLAIFPEHGRDSQTLLQKAEMALDKAKELGKSRVTVFTEQFSKVVHRRIELIHKLRLALKHHEFELYYQPKICLDSGLITGVEALIRWRTTEGEIIGPNEFIPLAEQSNLIIELDDWVIEEACRRLRIWHQHGHPDFTIAVNLSARQFLNPDLVDKLFSALDRNNLRVRHLHLEITEHTMVEHIDKTTSIMKQLARSGFAISIDDFGTGFSSLSYLKQFPITTLKIDRSFVKGLPSDNHDKTIVSLVRSLAQSLGMSVIAEGVETRKQLDFLRRLDCDEFQGYLCSQPLPADELEKFIRKHKVWAPSGRKHKKRKREKVKVTRNSD